MLADPARASVAEFVAQGLTNKQIARQLLICEDTVKKHLKNIFGKLGVHHRSQLAALQPPQRPIDPWP